MRIARVIGTVTLNRQHPTLQGGQFKLAVPLSWQDLVGRPGQPVEEVVLYDELGAGQGSWIAVSEGREAAMPFHPEIKPLDAYNAAILDQVCVLPPEKLVLPCQEPQTSGQKPKT
jgi:ethanolamine utilization protein EutN